MGSLTDLTGRRFGRLHVVRRAPNQGRRVMWLCQCTCGHRKTLATDYLTSKGYRSCGCLRNEFTRKRSTTHGDTIGRHPTKEYRAWSHMKGRCYNPTDPRYGSCGGRGITVYAAWRKDFAAFLRDVGRSPPNGMLKRRDIDRDYAPDNCFWEIPSQSVSHRWRKSSAGARFRPAKRPRSSIETIAAPARAGARKERCRANG